LVVIAIIAVLAALILPALSRAKHKAQGIQCLNNHRQLWLAWWCYAEDNRDRILFSWSSGPDTDYATWVTGWLDFSANNRSNWDPDQDIRKSPMWPYCGKNLGIWKCPADHSFVTVNGQARPRVRSMSMNIFMGGYGGGYTGPGTCMTYHTFNKIFLRLSDIVDPPPVKAFVFLDMREDSIDVGNFATYMAGYPDQPSLYFFGDLPGFYHNNGCGFSFADGHSETRRWRDSRTTPPLVIGGLINDHITAPGSPDIAWLQDHATRPRGH
jgi:prepilin-type processing-associated H-X9-DG protein